MQNYSFFVRGMVVLHVYVTVRENRLQSKFTLRMEQYRNQRTCIYCDHIKGVRRRRTVIMKSWKLQI